MGSPDPLSIYGLPRIAIYGLPRSALHIWASLDPLSIYGLAGWLLQGGSADRALQGARITDARAGVKGEEVRVCLRQQGPGAVVV